MFGIIDLASIPKDRYYLYRSVWNKKAETFHILPHWTWPGREGQPTPVFVYTNYPSAELFINGKSYGRQTKLRDGEPENRYRLMWHNAIYEPGELKWWLTIPPVMLSLKSPYVRRGSHIILSWPPTATN